MNLPDLQDQAWVGIGSIATLIGAIATFAAVIVALGAIVVDRRARSAEDRMRQARRVSAWILRTEEARPPESEYNDPGRPGVTVATLLNSSEEPVYRLIAWLVIYPAPATGEALMRDRSLIESEPAPYGVVPPGTFEIDLPEFIFGMMRQPAVEVSFTDAAGRHWIRRQDGRLVRINKPPVDHYGLSEPLDWKRPRSLA